MGAPGDDRGLLGVVVWEVVHRHFYWQPLAEIAEILVCQRAGVVLGVAGDEDLPAVPGGDDVDPGDVGQREDLQLRVGRTSARRPRCAGSGGEEPLVEAPHQRLLRAQTTWVKIPNTSRAAGALYAVVVVERGLGAPADVERMDVLLAQLHDLAELVPVVHC